jgi:hypothetical protein
MSQPRFQKISRAVEHSGLSRSSLYLQATKRPDLFRKNGRSTLVDFSVLNEILDELPQAVIKLPKTTRPD